MALRFPNPQTVQVQYADVLDAWAYPLPVRPVSIPSAEAFAEIQIVKRWSMRSRTAQSIIRRIEESNRRINVVCFRNQGSTVFAAETPTPHEGTVFWDLEARFASRQPQELGEFHHHIAFLHELGHAIQWMETPGFYAGNMLHGSTGREVIATAANQHWMARAPQNLTYQQRRAWVEERAPRTQMQGAAWNVRLEMDNLMRHEWPICDEARYPRRMNYTDLVLRAPGSRHHGTV